MGAFSTLLAYSRVRYDNCLGCRTHTLGHSVLGELDLGIGKSNARALRAWALLFPIPRANNHFD